MISFRQLLAPTPQGILLNTFMLAFKTKEVIQYFQTGAYKIAVEAVGVDGYRFFLYHGFG